MDDPTGGWLTWVVDQGVAVAVLVFLLVRLEARMARLEQLLTSMSDRTAVLLEAHITGAHVSTPNLN